jgi:hypothetical protein
MWQHGESEQRAPRLEVLRPFVYPTRAVRALVDAKLQRGSRGDGDLVPFGSKNLNSNSDFIDVRTKRSALPTRVTFGVQVTQAPYIYLAGGRFIVSPWLTTGITHRRHIASLQLYNFRPGGLKSDSLNPLDILCPPRLDSFQSGRVLIRYRLITPQSLQIH